MIKKILIIVEDYPSEQKPYAMSYVHSRCLEYISKGINIDVINFSSSGNYVFEGVMVNAYSDSIDCSQYDVVVSHAPNIRNHVFNLLKHMSEIKSLVIYFHGHEVLYINDFYPKPYSWSSKNLTSKIFQSLYDRFKIIVLRFFLFHYKDKVKVIFVSDWMKSVTHQCFGTTLPNIRQYVINNPAHASFLKFKYTPVKLDEMKFITIRPLDDSKYAIDLVVKVAKNNPQCQFDIYGRGDYFLHNDKPSNVNVINKFIHQNDLPLLLNNYSCALMPTRLDAQGVMVCEMASLGMPVITSNIEVCREIFTGFDNVILVGNNDFDLLDLSKLNLTSTKLNFQFDTSSIVEKEIEVFSC